MVFSKEYKVNLFAFAFILKLQQAEEKKGSKDIDALAVSQEKKENFTIEES